MGKQIKDLYTEVKQFENKIDYMIKNYSIGYKEINELITKNDREFLELVRDYIGGELYEKNKDLYVVIDDYNSICAIYDKSDKNNPDAFPYTIVLEKEHLLLNASIRIMEQNNNEFSKFIEIFNYDAFKEYYNFLFTNVKEFVMLLSTHIYDIFSEDDLVMHLLKLDVDELFAFKCFAEAKLELPSIANLSNSSIDKETHYKVLEIVTRAYDHKREEINSNRKGQRTNSNLNNKKEK